LLKDSTFSEVLLGPAVRPLVTIATGALASGQIARRELIDILMGVSSVLAGYYLSWLPDPRLVKTEQTFENAT